jgi:hypothetical protein
MRYLAALLVLAVSSPASADPITWKAANEVSNVNDGMNIWPGLEPGTPWELSVTFDPDSTPTVLAPGCNVYSAGPATFKLGDFSYTSSGGEIYTNAGLPEVGCFAGLPEGEAGLIQFLWGSWTEEPGAWPLNDAFGILLAGYYDLNVKDGTLPTVPVFDPNGGIFGDLKFRSMFQQFDGGPVHFQLVEQPTAVPEPATMTMLGAGLLTLIAAKRRRR